MAKGLAKWILLNAELQQPRSKSSEKGFSRGSRRVLKDKIEKDPVLVTLRGLGRKGGNFRVL